jgi:hypothetical protein
MLLFFLLFGVRPNRYLTYRTSIYVDRAFYIFKVYTVESAGKLYFRRYNKTQVVKYTEAVEIQYFAPLSSAIALL